VDRNGHGTRQHQDNVAKTCGRKLDACFCVPIWPCSNPYAFLYYKPSCGPSIRFPKHCVEPCSTPNHRYVSLAIRMTRPPRPGIRTSKRLLSREQQRERPTKWTPPFTVYLPDGERRNRLRTCPSALSCPLMCSTICHTWTQLPLPCSNYAPRSESQSRSPTALNGRIETRHCVGSEKSYSGHTPTLRLFTVDCCYFHLPDHWQAPVTNPAAIVLPVLALVFLSLLTSLADVTRRTLSSYVPGSRPGIVSRMKLMRISASRTQKDWLTHRRKAFTVRHRLQ